MEQRVHGTVCFVTEIIYTMAELIATVIRYLYLVWHGLAEHVKLKNVRQ